MVDTSAAVTDDANATGVDLSPLADEPTYDPKTDTYTTTFDTESTDAGYAVVAALARVRRCDVTDIQPLSRSLDPDALETLVGDSTTTVAVEAVVEGFQVTVRTDGRIEIRPPN